VSTSLLVSSGAVSCYLASMVNFIWFTDVSTKQHWGIKSGITWNWSFWAFCGCSDKN